MPPELVAALTAVLVAACGFLTAELRARTARREAEQLAERVTDVQRRVGADRRMSDSGQREPPGA